MGIDDYEEYLIENNVDFCVYLFPPEMHEKIADELGSIRATSFNKLLSIEKDKQETDIDRYDKYYTQFVLYDKHRKEIIGGQRFKFHTTKKSSVRYDSYLDL